MAKKEHDHLEKFYLVNHVYLLELQRALLDSGEYYADVWINEAEILDNIDRFRPEMSRIADRRDYDHAAAFLKISDVIKIFRVLDNGKPYMVFIQLTKRGVLTMMSGEFLRLQLERNIQLQTLSISSKQTTINWLLVLATVVAAVMPWFVALKFPPTVNVPVQPVHQDIRIDSVWLRHEIDAALYKKLSTQQQAKSTKQPHPKLAAQ